MYMISGELGYSTANMEKVLNDKENEIMRADVTNLPIYFSKISC